MSREQRLAEVFVELADTLVDDFDVLDLLHTLCERSVELLQANAAGLILADQRSVLHLMASTTEEARLLELFVLQNDEGPCLDCYSTGEQMVNIDLAEVEERWPHFRAATIAAGFRSTHAIPLRLRGQVIGVLNLFCTDRANRSDADVALGQALCDIATVGLLQERTVRHGEVRAEQLQSALNSRILLEQAKGVLSERSGISVDAAFKSDEGSRPGATTNRSVPSRTASSTAPSRPPRSPPAEPDHGADAASLAVQRRAGSPTLMAWTCEPNSSTPPTYVSCRVRPSCGAWRP